MTVEQMNDVIQDYCSGGDCDKCQIKHLCEPILGHFKGHPDVCKQAYEVVSKSIDNPVSHPSHYTQGNIECIDAMVAAYGKEAVSTFCLLNAFKYLWRSEHKNGKEDLEKAIWYLKKRLEVCESE